MLNNINSRDLREARIKGGVLLKNLKDNLKRALSFVLGFVLFVGPLPLNLAMATGTDSVIRNPESVILDNNIKLSKTAKPVEGYVNKYEITLRIESPRSEKTSDTVIVIDRSGSMKGNRLTKAKEAAKSLAEKLLNSGNTTNKVAVVSFGTDVTVNSSFSSNYGSIANAIDSLEADGGTFTQAAVRAAANLISSSTAAMKNIVFLSDGEPTYSHEITVPRDYLTSSYAQLVW